ncbi:hypothetical protein O3P69_020566 [Scylla paramamosain]|uniref:Uncharacterized protein n=1 Tax=Scylla paramamosain TaxID=85552 RepID=A0AAW0TMK5_SCYPA
MPLCCQLHVTEAEGRDEAPATGSSMEQCLGKRIRHSFELLASARQWSRPEMAMQLDLEVLVRRAYPEASEEMITILLRDQFVDAIDNQQLRIYVQQAHPKDLQEALARGLEMESFLRTTRERPSGNYVPQSRGTPRGTARRDRVAERLSTAEQGSTSTNPVVGTAVRGTRRQSVPSSLQG